ncbi:MAG: dUTP diphosphatase [Candidatus Berkelbacteria bacterium]|nr:dUTP diphosphatase [Candidatus Berkelbacteria bacterium]
MEPSKEKSEKLKIKKLSPDAKIPNFAREGDAGLDLYSMDSIAIPAGSRAGIQTGIALEIPEGKAGLIWDRAGLSSKQGLKVLGGVIDSGYRGEIIVTLANISREPVELPKGSKIAQIIIQPFEKPEIEIADELSESERGENGFGSSDILEQEEPIVEDDYDILDEELNEEMGEDGKSRW